MIVRFSNLSMKEIEEKVGVKFPEEFKKVFKECRQEDVSVPLKKNTWHCFKDPFQLSVGEELAPLVLEHLAPLSKQFKARFQVVQH